MADSNMRTRVERLLKGDKFRTDDITRLFLFARDRCDGRESVQEIGDFVAHHDERTKGIITRTVKDFYEMLCVKIPHLKKSLDGGRLPPRFPEFLNAMARRLDHKIIKRDTGLSRADAVRRIPKIISSFHKNADGTWSLTNLHTKTDIRILNCFCSYLVMSSAFNGERLLQDFEATIRSHGLLEKSEVSAFAKWRPQIQLYAVAVMHNCTIRLDDGQIANLRAAGSAGKICVRTSVPITTGDGKEIFIASDIFSTDLQITDWCHPSLWGEEIHPGLPRADPDWGFDLEVTDDGNLVRLGRQ